jgi:hypothetical protein
MGVLVRLNRIYGRAFGAVNVLVGDGRRMPVDAFREQVYDQHR